MSFARDAESSASACLSIWKVEPRAFRGGRGRRGRDWKGGWRVATSRREIFVLQLRLGSRGEDKANPVLHLSLR